MPSTQKDIIGYINEKLNGHVNEAPSLFVNGGKSYPLDLSERIKMNKQIVIIAHEFLSSTLHHAPGTVQNYIKEGLGLPNDFNLGTFYFEEIGELETVLSAFAEEFDLTLDFSQIIHRVSNSRREDTRFHLYLPVLSSAYIK